MYEKMIVPLDGSPLAEAVLPYARALAKGLSTRVEVLQVIEPQAVSVIADTQGERRADTIKADLERDGIAYLETVAGAFPDPITVACKVEIGEPSAVIAEVAGREPGTLICMATHGRSGIQRWLLGSVAEKTLRRARNPLLLVRPDEKMSSSGVAPLKKIIVPLDGSRLAERALEHAEGLAKKLQAAIILARVYQVPVMTYFAGEGDTPDVARITEQVMTQLKREAERYLEQKIVELRSRGLTDVSFVLLEGDAGTEIIDFARRTGENLVVMSSHGRSGLNRALMGSVAERVARHSGDPVLIVRVASEY